MSALGQKAGMCSAQADVRFTPKSGHWLRRRLNLAVHGLEGDVRHGGNVNS